MGSFIDFLSRPLTNLQIFLSFVGCLGCIAILIQWDLYCMKRKVKNFPQKHPQAASIYLCTSEGLIKSAKVECIKGEASQAFLRKNPFCTDDRKSGIFYATPGLVTVTVLLCCKGENETTGKRSYTGRFSFNAEPDGVYRIVFDAQTGESSFVLQKGKNLCFEVKEQKKPIKMNPQHIWYNCNQKRILGNFTYRKQSGFCF